MSTLARQQQAMLQLLLAPSDDDGLQAWTVQPQAQRRRGLQAYRANAQSLAQRARAAAYPVMVQMLGEESFAVLAVRFWQAHPPQRGDLAQWGGELAGYIPGLPQLGDEAYLPDVARIEWALHAAATAPDGPMDGASLQMLGTHDPATLQAVFASGLCLIDSDWPVASMVLAHSGDEQALQKAGERLRAGTAECALVWRKGLRPQLRVALPGEAAFLRACLDGESLLGALELAPSFDFAAWLGPAVAQELLTGVLTH